jgi:bifunctional ADP-heptose synthase (sugar kinase/adenylyltransferase)
LRSLPGVDAAHFFRTPARRTFTYCKPLITKPGEPPRELNRLDSKNWTQTPAEVSERLAASFEKLRTTVDAVILMDQVDVADTGVVTSALLKTVGALEGKSAPIPVLADSRRGLHGFPSVNFKMNAAELAALTGMKADSAVEDVRRAAVKLAEANGRAVFVTLAERGLVGALPEGRSEHVSALPLRGTIDVVGAGDSVTANLATALAAGADLREALGIAALASSIVIHQLGTSGSASVAQMKQLLG